MSSSLRAPPRLPGPQLSAHTAVLLPASCAGLGMNEAELKRNSVLVRGTWAAVAGCRPVYVLGQHCQWFKSAVAALANAGTPLKKQLLG